MSKREDKFNALFTDFKEEQNRFKEEQNKFNEKLIIINKKMAEQNKKYKRGIIFMMLVCLFVSGITSVASYTLGASSVEYTAKDSNWHVENTQEAIDDLYNSLGSALVGSVYSYMGTSAPYGYLACDGSTYNIEDYPRLANHINRSFGSYNYFGGDGETTFAVPDLRGEFLRGTGTNSHVNTKLNTNEGSGGNVGTHQSATVERGMAINTAAEGWLRITSRIDGSGNTSATNSDAAVKGGTWDVKLTPGWEESGNKAELYTTRPTNTSVLYIIKY